jgi:hypothetical protein
MKKVQRATRQSPQVAGVFLNSDGILAKNRLPRFLLVHPIIE